MHNVVREKEGYYIATNLLSIVGLQRESPSLQPWLSTSAQNIRIIVMESESSLNKFSIITADYYESHRGTLPNFLTLYVVRMHE